MAKRFYATQSFPLVALLISFPKTLPIAYSPPVTLAGQAILLFLPHLRLAAASGHCVICSLSLNCSPQDICWWPLLIWNFLYEAYSDDHILKCNPFPSPRFPLSSSAFCPSPPYHLLTHHIVSSSLPYYIYGLVSISLLWKLSYMRVDIFVYLVHWYISSINYSLWLR